MLKVFVGGVVPVLAAALPILTPSTLSAMEYLTETSKATQISIFHQERYLESTGIEPLGDSELPPGDEEARIWFHSRGAPNSFFRIWQHGGEVDGELVFHWSVDQRDASPGESFDDLIVHSHAGRCDDFRLTENRSSCRGVFVDEPDWLSIYQRAWEKGMWDLPDQFATREPTSITLGGWSMVVELRRGDEYRAYSYSNPDRSEEYADDRQALAIANLFRGHFDSLERPYSEILYRGIVPSQLSNAFIPCGSDTPKVMSLWLFEHSMVRNYPLPLPSEYGLEVEMRAIKAPDWLARQFGWAPGQGLLQQIQLKSVRPAIGPGRTCSDAP